MFTQLKTLKLFFQSCATLYSGLLLSITTVISTIASKENNSKVLDIIKTILTSRPMPFVVTSILDLVKNVSGYEKFLTAFCPGNGTGNLKTDYDQGVLLYKKGIIDINKASPPLKKNASLNYIWQEAVTQAQQNTLSITRGIFYNTEQNFLFFFLFQHKQSKPIMKFHTVSDSCFIQVLLKQTEACLKCIEKQNLGDKAVETTQSLINLYTNINDGSTGSLSREKTRYAYEE